MSRISTSSEGENHMALPGAEAPQALPRFLHPFPPEFLHMPTLPAVTRGSFGNISSSDADAEQQRDDDFASLV